MPLYGYLCQACGPFEEHRPVTHFEKPAPCPICKRRAPRMVSAAQLSLMNSDTRKANMLNERNANQPRVRRRQDKHHHRDHSLKHSCGLGKCCHGQHQHKSDRPWMVGH